MPANADRIFLSQLNSYAQVINCTFEMKTSQSLQFLHILYQFVWCVYRHWEIIGRTVHKSVLQISKYIMYCGYIMWMSSCHICFFIYRKYLQVTVCVNKSFPALRWLLAFHIRHCLAWKGGLASQLPEILRKPRRLFLQTLKESG